MSVTDFSLRREFQLKKDIEKAHNAFIIFVFLQVLGFVIALLNGYLTDNFHLHPEGYIIQISYLTRYLPALKSAVFVGSSLLIFSKIQKKPTLYLKIAIAYVSALSLYQWVFLRFSPINFIIVMGILYFLGKGLFTTLEINRRKISGLES